MKKSISFMRVLILMFIMITEITQKSSAQNPAFSSGLTHYDNVQVFRLKANTFMSKKKWRDVIYRFPEFKEGRITLAEGFTPTHILKMNFNNYEQSIEFITEKGDTSTFNESDQIKLVIIDNKIFYNDHPSGYIEKINQTPVSLGAKHLLKMMFESNNGEVFNATDWHMPTTRIDRLYVKKDEYYFIDKSEMLHRATLPSILKIYHSSKQKIKKYVNKNKVDFKVKEDLILLLDYCKQFEEAS